MSDERWLMGCLFFEGKFNTQYDRRCRRVKEQLNKIDGIEFYDAL